MSAFYQGSTAAQWVGMLQTAALHERCAAALALAEFEPNMPPAKDALLAALRDAEMPVRVAAQIAISFIHTPAENRRRMFEYLLGDDEEKQRDTLTSLEGLAYSTLQGAASGPLESETAISGSRQLAARTPMPALPTGDEPDVAVVTVLPWWFLGAGVTLIVGLAWLLRGVWWSKWPMATLAAVAVLYLCYSWKRRQERKLSLKRLHARGRLAGAAILAGACGFVICTLLPLGTVIIDNESRENVRLMIDGTEWLTIGPGETGKSYLPAGMHRLAIVDRQGERTLDAHDIGVTAPRQHVLNVLGGQICFQGIVQYGIKGGATEVITAKWFLVPEVDYLFQDPPESIVSVNPVNKSFLTKGRPPLLTGGR